MDAFQTLFGTEEGKIKTTCVLLPFLHKEILRALGVKKISRGKLYGVGQSKYFTVIHTGMGAPFLGDAVLYLEETGCRNVILFGACGLVEKKEGLKVGSLVSPERCYAGESFSRMLSGSDEEWEAFHPDRELHLMLLKSGTPAGVQEVVDLSVGSIKLQEERLVTLRQSGIEVVDMECAALFAAAAATGLRALALLFVTDIVGEKPYYRKFSAGEKITLLFTIRRAVKMLCRFINEKLKG